MSQAATLIPDPAAALADAWSRLGGGLLDSLVAALPTPTRAGPAVRVVPRAAVPCHRSGWPLVGLRGGGAGGGGPGLGRA